MKYIKLLVLLAALACSLTVRAASEEYVWYDGSGPVRYSLEVSGTPVVATALDMWLGDMNRVTGMKPEKVKKDAAVRIVQLDAVGKSKASALAEQGVPVDSLKARKEAFYIAAPQHRGYPMTVVGSDANGTAYGILELSRLAGVSPWVWWADATPRYKDRLAVPADYVTFQSPSVEYRGIFINDEDWSLQPWSWQTFEPGPMGRIGARTYKEVFKLLMRLRGNMIWPAMHGDTVPFYFTPGAMEAADSCGIAIGTSHCEPLMRNNVGEWDAKRRGPYNYITNRDSVQAYWVERLKEAGKYRNIYTLGMRGVHDSGMEGVGNDLDEKTKALQQVIDDQRKLLAKYVNKNVTAVPQAFVPYKEVLEVMENGLNVPDDVTLMWCDDNYGYLTRLSDTEQQKRKGGGGIYYHLSYWGRPHDYLWLTTTQPGLIWHQMRQAYDKNARKVWIANVHDPKPAAYDLELFMDMAWNIDGIGPDEVDRHLGQWLEREFGAEAGRRLLPAMLEFYRLTGIRKPEHMGWTQVELADRKAYPAGRSAVVNTEFSLKEFGGELDRYLEDYAAVARTVRDVEALIPADRRDTYFSHIEYPVLSAEAMARKMLEAQRARSMAIGQHDKSLRTRDEAMRDAVAKSQTAYRDIQNLADYYNNEMAGGKWKGSMTYMPRDLNVFNPPTVPVGLTDREAAERVAGDTKKIAHPLKADGVIARNACDFTRSEGNATPVRALGRSMNAVALEKGATLVYEFDSPYEGEALLRTAVIPTQPNDRGDIRVEVSLDGGAPEAISFREKGRTDTWKLNVLRGQSLLDTRHKVGKGRHTLAIKALDDNIVVDQWIIDFTPDRKYYMIPVKSK